MVRLIGREREVHALSDAIDAALAGRGSVVALVGEPGIGKSRLATEAASRAAEQGMHVVWGRCWEAGGAPPGWAFREALRATAGSPGFDAAVAALGPRARWLAALAPELAPGSELPAPEDATSRFATYDAASSFLQTLAEHAPRMIVLDDLHAADRMTVELLAFVARSIRSRRVVVVATWRAREARLAEALADVLATVAREAIALPLTPLDDASAEALVRDAMGASASTPESVRALVAASDGNPLFLQELSRAHAAGHRTANPGAGATAIDHAVRAHVDRLSPGARGVAAAAAVLGRSIEPALLRRLAADALGADAIAVRSALDELRTHEILVESEEGRISFTHALVRDAIHAALPTDRRALLHAAAVVVLESAGASPSEVAHHALAAVPVVSRARAAELGRAAAAAAAASYAHADAATLLRRAVDTLDGDAVDDREMIALRLDLAEAEVLNGRVAIGKELAERAADAADRLGAADLLARAALIHGLELTVGTNDQLMIRLLSRALEVLDPAPSPLRARLLARYATALWPSDTPEHPAGIAREAFAMARDVADPMTRLEVLYIGRFPLVFMEPPERWLAYDEEAVAIVREHGNALQHVRALAMVTFSRLGVGDVSGAEAAIGEMLALSEQFSSPQQRFRPRLLAAMNAIRKGQFADGMRMLEETEALAKSGPLTSAIPVFMVSRLGWARVRRDRDAIATLLVAHEGTLSRFPNGWALLSWMHAFTGNPDSARAALARRNRVLRGRPTVLLCLIAEAAALVGAREVVEELYELLVPRTHESLLWGMIGFTAEGTVASTLGRLDAALGRLDDAERHFALGVKLDDERGSRPMVAHALMDWAEMLIATGDDARRARAAPLLERAAAIYDDIDLGFLAQRAREHLASLCSTESSTGASDPAAPTAAALSLTREGDVYAVRFAGELVRVRDSKGLRYLELLVDRRGQPIHALDLLCADGAFDPKTLAGSDAGPLLDDRARESYRARLADLAEDLDEAERFADEARIDRLRTEIDALVEELSRATGLGGRSRRAGSAAERARVNVQRRLRAAIDTLSRHSRPVAQHLETALRTGAFCCYDP